MTTTALKRAIYPGSFDPITNGHVDIVHRSLTVFDEVTIVVAASSRKNAFIEADERVRLIKEIFQDSKKIKVDRWDGLTMDYARQHGAHAVIRGLRAASDFEYEFMMAAMNKNLHPSVETFFMMTGQNLFFISSSMIRELVRFGADIGPYVPAAVAHYLRKKKQD